MLLLFQVPLCTPTTFVLKSSIMTKIFHSGKKTLFSGFSPEW